MIVIDIETIPDQTVGIVAEMAETLTVKAPDLTKPKLIDLVEGGDKFKSVAELKEMWLEQFGEVAKFEQAEAKWLKTSFDGGYGKICCICVDIDGDEKTFSMADHENERALLIGFWATINGSVNTPYFVAHNMKFDLPFLWHRSVINSVAVNNHFKPHGRHDSDNYCTMLAWAGYGGKISLNNLAKILGLGQKTEGMDGSQVWPEYQKGNIKKISDYCMQDVRLTKDVYNRLNFV